MLASQTSSVRADSTRKETAMTGRTTMVEHRKDSARIKDSVSVRRHGDTVYVERWHWEYLFHRLDNISTDMEKATELNFGFAMQTDTIREPYAVEKELTAWQRIKMEYAAWAFGAMCVLLAAAGAIIYRKCRYGKDGIYRR